ncbi:unnamed protein product [Cuscuta campestris]|uniref:Uncharacterized protein n=1 Tax=Cuscuta campestris TaxID=132261 RepID=A0A484K569_9ASTE|nr:unnamed protein product [Cuscuta campestris]
MNIIEDDPKNDALRTEASTILYVIDDFEFAFVLHLMEKVLGITYELSQALQRKEQDLANVIALVRIAKIRLQTLKSVGFEKLLDGVIEFCKKHDIHIPNVRDFYHTKRRSRQNASTFKFSEYFKSESFDNVKDDEIMQYFQAMKPRRVLL